MSKQKIIELFNGWSLKGAYEVAITMQTHFIKGKGQKKMQTKVNIK